jgi:hypothetical protein
MAQSNLMGRYVTISWAGAPHGVVGTTVGETDRTLALTLQPSQPPPGVGTLVRCFSVVGEWNGQVLTVDGHRLTLALPSWSARLRQRRSKRLRVDHHVALDCGDVTVSGRLVDLSLGGGAVLVEKDTGVVNGAACGCRLPPGPVAGIVTSVRPAGHPMLVTVGVRWTDLPIDAARWVGQQIAEASAGLRARPTLPGPGVADEAGHA